LAPRARGKQVAVDTFPMAAALSRDGRYLLVLNADTDHHPSALWTSLPSKNCARSSG